MTGNFSPRTYFLIFLFIVVGLGSCAESHEIPENAVRVGFLLPFTGEDAASRTNYEHAALMVRDEVNSNGGIDGRPLAFITRDTHSTVEGALEALAELEEENVVAVLGPENTEIARVVLRELQKTGIPLISPVISGGDSIELVAGYKWYRLSPSASILGRSFANRLWDDGVRRLSVVYSSDDYSLDFIGALSSRFAVRGGEMVSRVYLRDGELSYGDEVSTLQQGGSVHVAISASVETAARFVNELTTSSSDFAWKWYLSPQLETPVFPQNTVPGAVEGALGVGTAVPGADELFRQKYVKKWNTEPLDGAYFYYDATSLLALSLEQAMIASQALDPPGALSSGAIREAIDSVAYRQGVQVKWNQLNQGLHFVRTGQEISYSGLSGPILFDELGQQQTASLKYWSIQQGEVVDDVE